MAVTVQPPPGVGLLHAADPVTRPRATAAETGWQSDGVDETAGIQFPVAEDGHRSTTAVGRAVVADALRRVDPAGAAAVEREPAWRTGYLTHFRRLVEAGLGSPADARTIASDGLASLRGRLRVVADGEERDLEPGGRLRAFRWRPPRSRAPVSEPPSWCSPCTATGCRATRCWSSSTGGSSGVVEPSVTDALRQVAAHPEWLRLDGWTVGVVGAAAEMGPTRALLRWGARVAAVDVPVPQVWERLAADARARAGTLLVPVADPRHDPQHGPHHDSQHDLAATAGVDLTTAGLSAAAWLEELHGPLVVGTTSTPTVGQRPGVGRRRPAHYPAARTAGRTWHSPSSRRRPTSSACPGMPRRTRTAPGTSGRGPRGCSVRPVRAASGGRLLQRSYPPGPRRAPGRGPATPSSCSRGPATRWPSGSSAGAPPRSALRGASCRSTSRLPPGPGRCCGAARSPRRTPEPTASVSRCSSPRRRTCSWPLSSSHDLHTGGGPRHDHPWQDEAHAAVHGGLWRTAYAPRSALGLAALLGHGASGR